MTHGRWLLAGILAAALGALALTDPAALRLGAAVVGCLLLPGLGWARKLTLGDRGDTAGLAIVLSTCSTVAVGTTMALAGIWSLPGGLAALAVVTGAGFVPFGALADRAAATARSRAAGFGDDGTWADWMAHAERQTRRRRQRAKAIAEQANDVWVDWYADVERRTLEVETRRAAAAQAATDAWVAWYDHTQLSTAEPGTKNDDR